MLSQLPDSIGRFEWQCRARPAPRGHSRCHNESVKLRPPVDGGELPERIGMPVSSMKSPRRGISVMCRDMIKSANELVRAVIVACPLS